MELLIWLNLYGLIVSSDATDGCAADGPSRGTCSGVACSTADDGAFGRPAHGILTRCCAFSRAVNPIAHQRPADGSRRGPSTGITGNAADHRALGCPAQYITRLRGKRTAQEHRSERSTDHQLPHLDISHAVVEVR
jgi:hypothetical protein